MELAAAAFSTIHRRSVELVEEDKYLGTVPLHLPPTLRRSSGDASSSTLWGKKEHSTDISPSQRGSSLSPSPAGFTPAKQDTPAKQTQSLL